MNLHWWWLSFADPSRPKEEQLLGVAIVESTDAKHAHTTARLNSLNPGGEVAIVLLKSPPPVKYRYRLLGPDEAKIASVLCIGQ